LSGLASSALDDAMQIMNLELPMFTMASQFNISYSVNMTNVPGFGCNAFYSTVLNFPQN
jgi:hypothetical protein